MENVGHKPKRALKQIKIVDVSGKVIKIIHHREEIERMAIKQNKIHHRKEFQIKTYKNKIYNKLLNSNVHNRILNRDLRQDECDESNIFEFLSLLYRKNKTSSTTRYQEILVEE